jgi:hypothetical protein
MSFENSQLDRQLSDGGHDSSKLNHKLQPCRSVILCYMYVCVCMYLCIWPGALLMASIQLIFDVYLFAGIHSQAERIS